jgi:hypothetical protein
MVVFTSGIVDGQVSRASLSGVGGLVTHGPALVGDGVKHTVGS